MKRIFIAFFCLLYLTIFAPEARAADGVEYPRFLQVSRAGDLDLGCHEISQEVSAMGEIIARAQEDLEYSQRAGAGIGIGKAVGSYLVGSLVGGIGIIAAGYIASEAAGERGEQAAEIQDAAMQRRSFMEGIYNARGCAGPLEAALIEPAAGESVNEEAAAHPAPRYSYND